MQEHTAELAATDTLVPRADVPVWQAYDRSLGQADLVGEALRPVADEIRQLNVLLPCYLPTETPTSNAIARHVFASGGKRIRPALYFFASRLTGNQGPHLYPIAAVCEYVHTASLLHDDVVDNSTLRRNKPTPNAIWGDEAAVLVGDLIYARASEMMAETGSLEIVKGFANAIRRMSEGELLQLEHIFDADAPVENYLRIVECKTAVLVSMACRAAGILANASSEQCQALATFGHAVGMAFQLVDDALDFLTSSENFGKPTMTDLKDGKVTLPVLLLREHLGETDALRLRQIFKDGVLTSDEREWVHTLVEQFGTAVATLSRAGDYTQRAKDALAVFPAGAARTDLETLADRLVWRDS